MRTIRHLASREHGNALVMVLAILFLLVAMGLAQFAVVHKNVGQSNYFLVQSELQNYAESGIALAAHDFDNYITGNSGNIGTENWQPLSDDVGRDGQPGTLDDGEGDGLPTPGEPNLAPAPIGPSSLHANLLVTVFPTPYVGVFRIVSSCYNEDGSFTVEKVYSNEMEKFSLPGTLFVNPEMQLVFGGGGKSSPLETTSTLDNTLSMTSSSSMLTMSQPASDVDTLSSTASYVDGTGTEIILDGRDHNGKGVLKSDGESTYGLATEAGETEGDNRFALLAQVPGDASVQVLGKEGAPSVGEVDGASFYAAFDSARGNANLHLKPGSHVALNLGSSTEGSTSYVDLDSTLIGNSRTVDRAEDGRGTAIVYADSDVTLTGEGGVGVLVVNGSLEVQGPFTFKGLIIVRGDVQLSGGTDGIDILGGLIADGARTEISGKTTIQYNAAMFESFKGRVRHYAPLYYKEH